MKFLSTLQNNLILLTKIQRGVEREALRVDTQGRLAQTPHPIGLGSALLNPNITTDYSEALVEMVTHTHHTVNSLFEELTQLHTFTLSTMGSEVLWQHSMPCELPDQAHIPIAWYGTSNVGMQKYVYRCGLAERYGKNMQCIAGIHYNFSLPDELWNVLGIPGDTAQDRQSNGYMALIRNFKRYSWLLMYLFGASPTINASFLDSTEKNLPLLSEKTAYLPSATSLRMSDLGYQNHAQSKLKSCYNSLKGYLSMIYDAVTQPWPPYEAIGTHRQGKWIQLNTNVLQIENEFYASIRPKRTIKTGERASTALLDRGIQYIEVRCLDVDPFSPVGISPSTAYFLDIFLVYCALSQSPLFDNAGSCPESDKNFATVVKYGREPSAILHENQEERSIKEWGCALMDDMQSIAQLLDAAYDTTQHAQALTLQRQKLMDVSKTPAQKWFNALKDSGLEFNEFALHTSQEHANTLLANHLPKHVLEEYQAIAKESLIKQKALETHETKSFESYLKDYEDQLKSPY